MSVFYFQTDIYLGFQNELRSDVSFIMSGVSFVLNLQVTRGKPPSSEKHHPWEGASKSGFLRSYPNRLFILLPQTKLFNRATQEHKIPAFKHKNSHAKITISSECGVVLELNCVVFCKWHSFPSACVWGLMTTSTVQKKSFLLPV